MKQYVATNTIPPYGRAGSRSAWFKRTQKTDTYDAIVAAGKDGITRADIAKAIGLAPDRISFYLSDLRRAGYISVVGTAPDVATMTASDAKFYAMQVLEGALVAKAAELKKKGPIPRELNEAFVRYNKLKQLALQGVGGEADSGLRMALKKLVDMVF